MAGRDAQGAAAAAEQIWTRGAIEKGGSGSGAREKIRKLKV